MHHAQARLLAFFPLHPIEGVQELHPVGTPEFVSAGAARPPVRIEIRRLGILEEGFHGHVSKLATYLKPYGRFGWTWPFSSIRQAHCSKASCGMMRQLLCSTRL